MHTKELIIIGAGGHAKVVIDAISLEAPTYQLRLWDENPAKVGTTILDFPIEFAESYANLKAFVHVAVGANEFRKSLFAKLSKDAALLTIIHPSALISKSAEIAAGSFIAAFARIAPDAFINEGCIINHGAIVDHDVKIGAFTHIAPNVTLGGGVLIGSEVLIGSSATVLPGRKIGEGCIVGAGSIVTRDLPPHTKVKGIPAR